MKKVVLYILFCLFSFQAFSQTPAEYINEAKYWVWRDMLVNDFMVPGTCTGCGIVFSKRGISFNLGYPLNVPNPYSWQYRGGFDISDEGFEMGKYLLVLASEWKLLHNSGLSTSKTELEIYYELKTIDRLDNDAEKYWSFYWPFDDNSLSNGEINGFMIRDDVFDNFLFYENVPTIGYTTEAYKRYLYLNQNGGISGKYIKQNVLLYDHDVLNTQNVHKILPLSAWNEVLFDPNTHHSGFSGAVAGLHASDLPSLWYNPFPVVTSFTNITGPQEYSHDNYIGLLVGLVAVCKFVDDGVCYNDICLKEYASSIIHRIINSIKENDASLFEWSIDNPVTDKCVKGVYWYDYLMQEIPRLNEYCNNGGSESQCYSECLAKINNKYSSISMTVPLIPFNGLPQFDYYYPHHSMDVILATLTGVRSEATVCSWVDHLPGYISEEFLFLKLYYCLLNDISDPQDGYYYYSQILNSKPCIGILNNNYTDFGINETRNHLTEMAIHNLLKLLKGEKFYFQKDDSDTYPRLVQVPMSPTEIPVCNETIETWGTLTSTSLISDYNGSPLSCSADITYHAGEKIILKPGFKVTAGAHFVAKIVPVTVCRPIPGIYDFTQFHDIGNTGISMWNKIMTVYENNENNPYSTEENNEMTVSSGKILAYPNPADDILYIETSLKNYNINLYNQLGQIEIFKSELSGNSELTLKAIKSGIYYLTLGDANSVYITEKIMKK